MMKPHVGNRRMARKIHRNLYMIDEDVANWSSDDEAKAVEMAFLSNARDMDVDECVSDLETLSGKGVASRHAVYVMMHKMRTNRKWRRYFTDGQQRMSRRWLKDHGYTCSGFDDPKLVEVLTPRGNDDDTNL